MILVKRANDQPPWTPSALDIDREITCQFMSSLIRQSMEVKLRLNDYILEVYSLLKQVDFCKKRYGNRLVAPDKLLCCRQISTLPFNALRVKDDFHSSPPNRITY